MKTQDLSYLINTDHIAVRDYLVSIEAFTVENLYFPLKGTLKGENGKYHSDFMVWGDDEIVKGEANLFVKEEGKVLSLSADASLEQDIRSIKIRIDGLPLGKLITTINGGYEINNIARMLVYPEGWRDLTSPFLVFDLGGRYLCIRSLADKVKEHRFYMVEENGTMRVDIVYNEDATKLSHHIATPKIEVFESDDLQEIYKLEQEYVEKTYGLVPFEQREDVPAWFKDISLVVTCHMEAYTGKIFHTYQKAKEEILKLTEAIDGKHILVYLPGWEGRYYYKYGNYCPDDRLGGEAALKDMVDALHQKGVHVMAMYGMTVVNTNLPGYETWGKPAEFLSCGYGRLHYGSVDWEGGHHHDSSFLYQLNVGNKCYQDYLFNQIKENSLKFDFDAAFLDIAACHVNDRKAKHYDGVVSLCKRLQNDIKKDFLVCGEGYYDGLAAAMPFFQGGHTDGVLHYHDSWYEDIFSKYSREFAHLCLGDFSRLSTGTHELGVNPETTAPYRKGIIPTLCLVDGTIEKNWKEVEGVLETAKRYFEDFCK